MHSKWYKTNAFIIPAVGTALLFGLFIVWQLGALSAFVYSLPRATPTVLEYIFGAALVLLVSVNVGLLRWQKVYGHCPVGTKRASGIASVLGAFAFICPACIVVPFTLFGTSIILSTLSPYIPMLQIVSLILLSVSTLKLWPKKHR